MALLAVKERTLDVLVDAGLNDAVKPAGNPVTVRSTALAKPFCPFTVIVLVAVPPGAMVRLADEAASVKLGDGTLTLIVVEPEFLPEWPFTVTLKLPVGVPLLALSIRALEVGVVAGLKDAVTPSGSPVAERSTFPLKPFSPITRMVLLALLPALSTSELFDVERLIVGAASGAAAMGAPAEQPAIAARHTVRHSPPVS